MLADGWSVETAADLLWAVVSIPVYEYLVEDVGWPADRYERELSQLVTAAFVRAPTLPEARRRLDAHRISDPVELSARTRVSGPGCSC